MAFKLTHAEELLFQSLIESLRSSWEKVEEARDAKTVDVNSLHKTVAYFGVICEEAETFRSEVCERWQSEFDDKSEKWQESDKGEAVVELIETWEALEFEAPGLPTGPDYDVEGGDYADEFEGLPVRVE